MESKFDNYYEQYKRPKINEYLNALHTDIVLVCK